MKPRALCLFSVLLISFSFVYAEIHQLNEANFNDEIAFGNWLIRFCDPKNELCKSTQSEWEEYVNSHSAINFGEVNCDSEPDFCLDQGVTQKNVPSFLQFADMDRTRHALKYQKSDNFNKQLEEWSVKILYGEMVTMNDDNYQALIEKGTWLINFGNQWDMHTKVFRKTWNALERKYRGKDDIKFAVVYCSQAQKVCSHFKIHLTPTLIFYKAGKTREFIADRFYEEFHINYSEAAVDSWISGTLAAKSGTWQKEDKKKKTEVENKQKARRNEL